MKEVVVSYFTILFSSNGVESFDDILCHITPKVTKEMNLSLISLFTDEEIKCAVFQMHPTKALGPDDISPGFYQKHWGVVCKDVYNEVQSMLLSGHILRKINYTHVTLIPKVKDATMMTQLRSISLCNVLYKIVAKVLTNRLKLILPYVISPTQSAFVPRCLILDNYWVAAEVAHYMHKRSSGSNGLMALKVDISKGL
ncbi:hypothetical protein COP1_022336 [Malus domestica]